MKYPPGWSALIIIGRLRTDPGGAVNRPLHVPAAQAIPPCCEYKYNPEGTSTVTSIFTVTSFQAELSQNRSIMASSFLVTTILLADSLTVGPTRIVPDPALITLISCSMPPTSYG